MSDCHGPRDGFKYTKTTILYHKATLLGQKYIYICLKITLMSHQLIRNASVGPGMTFIGPMLTVRD